MKKYIFTESQIKRVIDTVITEETSVDEGIGTLISKFGKPIVKGVSKFFGKGDVRPVGKMSQNIANMASKEMGDSYLPQKLRTTNSFSTMTNNLLSKYGTVKVTNFVLTSLKPAKNQFMIAANDIKRAESFVNPRVVKGKKYSEIQSLGHDIDELESAFDGTRGRNVIKFDIILTTLMRMKDGCNRVISNNEVTGNGLIHVKEAITALDKAIKETEGALGHIAVNHE
jgi:hypothetical protein